MSDIIDRPAPSEDKGRKDVFVVDKDYIHRQFSEAFTLFVTPFSGVIYGATGRGKRFNRRIARKARTKTAA